MVQKWVSNFNRNRLGHNPLGGSTVRILGAASRDSDIPNTGELSCDRLGWIGLFILNK